MAQPTNTKGTELHGAAAKSHQTAIDQHAKDTAAAKDHPVKTPHGATDGGRPAKTTKDTAMPAAK